MNAWLALTAIALFVVILLMSGCVPTQLQQTTADACAARGGITIWDNAGVVVRGCALPCVQTPAEERP